MDFKDIKIGAKYKVTATLSQLERIGLGPKHVGRIIVASEKVNYPPSDKRVISKEDFWYRVEFLEPIGNCLNK